MANSDLVTDLKLAIIKELVKDEAIFNAIDSSEIIDVKQAHKLVHKHIFPYHRIPQTITETSTLMTIQVHIREGRSRNKIFIIPTLEFWIYSHQDHMEVKNIPKVSDTRNDYISRLLDKKFNGRSSLGRNNDPKNDISTYGELNLVLNDEGSTQQGFLYRHMIFETRDLNKSLCEL